MGNTGSGKVPLNFAARQVWSQGSPSTRTGQGQAQYQFRDILTIP